MFPGSRWTSVRSRNMLRCTLGVGKPNLLIFFCLLLVACWALDLPICDDQYEQMVNQLSAETCSAQAACTNATGPSSVMELPRCASSRDFSDGCWFDTRTMTAESLSGHVSGNISAAVSWNRTWVPRTCSYHRFDSLSFTQACPRLAQGGSVVMLGDSGAARGLYCLLHSLLISGSETQPPEYVYGDPEKVGCGGLWPEAARQNMSYRYAAHETWFNETHFLRSTASMAESGRIYGWELGNFRVRWSYVFGLAEFKSNAGDWVAPVAPCVHGARPCCGCPDQRRGASERDG